MDKVLEKAKELRSEIELLPEYQEYMKLKDIFEKDEHLKNMREEIARLASENKKEERDNLLQIYNSHPLVNNFNIAKEEMKNLLETIKEILSD